jgi:superfamily II DNA/RNA helicase
LARELKSDGLNAEAIHGDKSQQDRQKTLDAFKAGEITVLVATDVAARGLDIAELPAVINYDLPFSPEDYVHRIGRTGRAGASGLALSLMVAGDERLLEQIEKLIGRSLKPEVLEGLPVRIRVPSEFSSGSDERSQRPVRRNTPTYNHSGASTNMSGASRYRTEPVDRFFLQPYEPSASAIAAADTSAAARAAAGAASRDVGSRRSARVVATLLGGKPPG